MNSRLLPAVAIAVVLCVPNTSSAQVQTEVTLTVPLQMTRVGPDVVKVAVWCRIRSQALPLVQTIRQVGQQQELPISGGQLNTTVSMVFSLAGLEDPVGQSASITCSLTGLSASTQQWLQFTPDALNPSFRTTQPTTTNTEQTFTW